ncbi:MAG: CoA-transferase [Acidobacteria bacterium]|nr:CoA-transferase [Acidobacteriota bacterium]
MASRTTSDDRGTSVLAGRGDQSPEPYTLSELMVASAAREIRDGELVFVGMRLPLVAFVVAKKTHAPGAIGLFENGLIRSTPAPELIYTMADPPNIEGATECLDMLGVMSLLASGRVDLGFLGAAEVDRFGNLNSTQVEALEGMVRLPGSGGACDIASLAGRFVVVLEHRKERLKETVSFMTSPGYGDGGAWRRRAGLPRGGPAAVITTKGILRFNQNGEAYLDSLHPGVELDDVMANTGWNLRLGEDVGETRPPSGEELLAMRAYDREGFWTR